MPGMVMLGPATPMTVFGPWHAIVIVDPDEFAVAAIPVTANPAAIVTVPVVPARYENRTGVSPSFRPNAG